MATKYGSETYLFVACNDNCGRVGEAKAEPTITKYFLLKAFMGLTKEQRDWLSLALVPGVGTVRFIRLLARFGTPARVLSAPSGDLADVVGAKLAERIRQHGAAADIELQENRMRELDAALITMDDPEYPSQLAEIYDPPLLLFAQGTLSEDDKYAIAIVGTRRASAHGQKITRELAAGLAARGVTVASGLAEGIDTAAHQGALDAGGRTIAVLASGLDEASPTSNIPLLKRIVHNGCALSSFPMGVRALRGNFPQRNRIVSGLSLGVVVVEAPPGSGALITARFAAEQGREVFAVPGPAGFANSRGPHELIRDGAKLVESVEDIITELNLPANMRQPRTEPVEATYGVEDTGQDTLNFSAPPKQTTPARKPAAPPQPAKSKLSAVETDILDVLHDEGSFVDEIALACRISVSEALSSLTMLELKGVVEQLSGKRFRPK